MMDRNKELSLFSDLIKVVKKYDQSTIKNLALLLKDDSFISMIDEILAKASIYSKPKSSKVPTKIQQSKKFIDSLMEMSKYDSQKSTTLLEIYNQLINKEALPTMRELKNFVLDNGLPPLNASSRDKAITPFVKILSTLNTDDLIDKVNRIQKLSQKDNRSLEGWSNIILNKDK